MSRSARRTSLALLTVALLAGGTAATAPPAAAAPAPSATAPRAVVGDRLLPGQGLGSGDALRSPSGRWALVNTLHGDLELAQSADALSAAPQPRVLVGGTPGARLVMQADGNAVLYGPGNVVYWSSATAGSPGASLLVQDDGNVVVYSATGRPLYDSGLRDSLIVGDTLLPGEQIAEGSTRLVLQADGNLVLYSNGVARFATGTSGPVLGAVLQDDNDLVVYSPSLRPLFATGAQFGAPATLQLFDGEFRVMIPPTRFPDTDVTIFGSEWASSTLQPGQMLFPGDRRTAPGGVVLIMQPDGNLVEYVAGTPRFRTGTRALGAFALMQPDGNVVVYDSGMALRPLFSTRTRVPGSRLVVQGDGNVVVYTPSNQVVFASQR